MPNHTLFAIIPPSAQKNIKITASLGFVSALGDANLFLIVHNKRGWDIPGGHLQKGESPQQAFIREVREETGCEVLPNPQLIAILRSTRNPATGIAVYKASCHLRIFKPHREIDAIDFVNKDELLKCYFGNKELLQDLLRSLQQHSPPPELPLFAPLS